jgi:hypothetical protein
MLLEDGTPYDGDAMVSPAEFLSLGAVPLNELTVVMDVRPVREEKVCCALVQRNKPKEGSQWWKICGGAGSHSHQGIFFLWTAPAVPPYAGDVRQSAILYDGYCCVP